MILPAHTLLLEDLIIKGDANLLTQYILENKTIFGVNGTLQEGTHGVETFEFTPTSNSNASVTFSHTLGAKPSRVLITSDTFPSEKYRFVGFAYPAPYDSVNVNMGVVWATSKYDYISTLEGVEPNYVFTANASSITIKPYSDAYCYFKSGVKYRVCITA